MRPDRPIKDPSLDELVAEMVAVRRDLHAHPETAFEERRTARAVADQLRADGIETHEGLAGTGVVGVLRRGSGACIALRADLDALPIQEENTFTHRSTHHGRMHACGHDGHAAMLLGAARWLRERGRFAGTVCFVFQPAEETGGGAGALLKEGLIERFGIARFFGLHNWPGLPAGALAILDGPVMAAADEFEVTIEGKGAHGAMPHLGADPIVAGAALVQSIQAIITRQLDPLDPAVISVTRFNGGHAYNVIPGRVVLGGTVRSFDAAVRDAMEASLNRMCRGVSESHGVAATLRYTRGYPATINDTAQTALCRAAATAIGAPLIDRLRPSMGAEDFSMYALRKPACYAWIGNGEGPGACSLHSPNYDFNDEVMATGIRYWTSVAETALPV